MLSLSIVSAVFTRESSYCFQRVSIAIAILSVRPSHGWISQNGASYRTTKSSPSAA